MASSTFDPRSFIDELLKSEASLEQTSLSAPHEQQPNTTAFVEQPLQLQQREIDAASKDRNVCNATTKSSPRSSDSLTRPTLSSSSSLQSKRHYHIGTRTLSSPNEPVQNVTKKSPRRENQQEKVLPAPSTLTDTPKQEKSSQNIPHQFSTSESLEDSVHGIETKKGAARVDASIIQQLHLKAKALRMAIDAQHAMLLEKANLRDVSPPIRNVPTTKINETKNSLDIVYDDMLPESFLLSSSRVRHLLQDKLELNLRLDSLCQKVSDHAILNLGFNDNGGIKQIAKAETHSEIRQLRAQIVRSEEYKKENQHLLQRVATHAAHIKSIEEERDTLVSSLRLALDKEEFKRLRVQAQYDEEKAMLKASFESMVDRLSKQISELRRQNSQT